MSDDPEATVIRTRHRVLKAHDPDATVIVSAGHARTVPLDAPPLPPGGAVLALAPGFRLHEYRIDAVLGQGGFGITYLATDVHLNAEVAIKEYLPEEIAFRAGDRSVSPNATTHRDRYRQGLDSFLVEARTLAAFRHPAIVRVARFFEAHRTAYMVLEYERGSPLKTWWPQHAGVGEAGLVELLLPLLDGLAAVHAAGFLHRDIKPDNIQVRQADGSLVLLDFGSAGQAVAVADQGAVVLTPGYAPIEQYGLGAQGPWTDLYALAATLYWAVTGRKPPDAEQRAAAPGTFTPAAAAGRGRYGDAFLNAIDWALNPDATQRPQTVAEFRRALAADHTASLDLQDALNTGPASLLPGDEAATPRRRALRRLRRAAAALFDPPAWPLALKMTLAMLATALLPMLMAGLYNLHAAQNAVTAAELRHVEQIAASTAGRVSQFITDSRHLARSLAGDEEWLRALHDGSDAAFAPLAGELARIVQAHPDLQRLTLVDLAGVARASSEPGLAGRSVAALAAFTEARDGRAYTGTLGYSGVAGRAEALPGVLLAQPVRSGEGGGAVLGVLLMRLRGASVAAIVDEVRSDVALTPFLVDRDGVLVHHLQDDLVFSSLAPLPEATQAAAAADWRYGRERVASLGETTLAAALHGAAGAGHVDYVSPAGRQPRIAGFAPVTAHDWVLGVSESSADFEAPLQALKTQLAWSVGLVGLLFTGLALRFARSIVRPLRALTAAAAALKEGRFDSEGVEVKRRDELGRLGRTFNVMIDVLRQRERERSRRGGDQG